MTTPIIGAQRRNTPLAANISARVATKVVIAQAGAAVSGMPSGTVVSMSKVIGMMVTEIIMMTVPATAGVRKRRNRARRSERANWNNEERTTRVASIAGPPSANAVTETAMNAPEVPMSSGYPAPTRPSRTDCITVVTPLTASAAKTAQVRNASLSPAARTMMAGVSTMPPMMSAAYWKPRPSERVWVRRSSGS